MTNTTTTERRGGDSPPTGTPGRGRDVLELLEERQQRLVARLDSVHDVEEASERRIDLVRALRCVFAHAGAAEATFYNALLALPALAPEALQSLRELQDLVHRMEQLAAGDARSAIWSTALRGLLWDLEKHAAREAQELFPRVARALDAEERALLGRSYADALARAEARHAA